MVAGDAVTTTKPCSSNVVCQANRSVSSLYMVTCVPTSKEVSQLADIIVGDASMLEAPFKEENRELSSLTVLNYSSLISGSKFHWIDCTSGFPPLTKAIAEKLRVASAADSVSRRETVFTDCAVSGGPHVSCLPFGVVILPCRELKLVY